jgi:hypothetical protein
MQEFTPLLICLHVQYSTPATPYLHDFEALMVLGKHMFVWAGGVGGGEGVVMAG